MDENSSSQLLNLNHERLVLRCGNISYSEPNSSIDSIECKNDITLNAGKLDSCEDKTCFESIQVDSINDLDSSPLKTHTSLMDINERVLISPTDFLTLSEEASSAVKKDVNLSTSRLEIIKKTGDSSLTIGLDRYCESPFLLDSNREVQLISDDDASNNGRVSRLSESHEEITPDDLFASTLSDQHNSLKEVVITPIDSENSCAIPVIRECSKYSISEPDINIVKEERFESDEMVEETISNDELKSSVVLTDELQQSIPLNHRVSPESKTIFEEETAKPTPTSKCSPVTLAMPITPLDIKILPTGLLQLAANLAASFPSSTIQKQIALQLLREDGTSIIVPITTKSQEVDQNAPNIERKDTTNQETIRTVPIATDVKSQTNDIERPFKCQLCNSTFTRLGNYTRHKKIHSIPSKEDQRFRCDICGKSFIQRCDLARHLHIHRGTEPHRCSQCGKGYIRHSDLVTHQRFHNKEKPFACPHCSKGFCQRGDLNRHLRSIHLQLKPILCSHCHKKFAKEETLLRHINANHRDTVVN